MKRTRRKKINIPTAWQFIGAFFIIVCAFITLGVNAYYVLIFRPEWAKRRKYREQSKYI